MKLTTAGYLRPSGKNIHRFEGAAESDEWGVRPNEGYEVVLTEDEMSKLLVARRHREAIVAPAKDGAKAAADESIDDPQLAKAVEYVEKQLAAKAADNKKEPVDAGKEQADPEKELIEAGKAAKE